MAILEYQNPEDSKYERGLRNLFGPSKKFVWRILARQIEGKFVEGRFFSRDKVICNFEQWTVTLDTFKRSHRGRHHRTHTRLRAPYVNKDGFQFTLYNANFFTFVGEMLGMTDMKIGDPSFDKQFVLKANSPEKMIALFSNPRIRELAKSQPRIFLRVKDDEGWFAQRFPKGVDELYFEARGVIKDISLLAELFELFSEVLHQLCHIGSAYENDPGITL